MTKSLSKFLVDLTSLLFHPSRIFTSFAEGITASMLTHLKGVPVVSLAFMLNGLVCGQLAARLTAATTQKQLSPGNPVCSSARLVRA